MFTAGQKTRMRSALTSNTSQRSSLWTSSNLIATGISTPAVLCQADFTTNSNYSNVMCAGDSVKYTDLAWNGNPTSWSWTFPGGTPSSSTDSTPIVKYYTPGLYNASLSVSNGSGTVSASKIGYIRVNPSAAAYSNSFYSEGFEIGGAIPNADWQVNNNTPGGNMWVQTGTASATGTKSVMLVNSAAQSGNVDDLISPSIDLTHITGSNIGMSFKLAYAQRISADADQFKIYVSTNCGKNWTLRKALMGVAMAGGVPAISSNFVPTSSQWTSQSFLFTASQIASNSVYVKFQFTSAGGNNIYLDDINIIGATRIDELESELNYNVFPNPADENTLIEFSLLNKERVSLEIYDVLGRQMNSIYNGELNSGVHSYSLNEYAHLAAGVYFVNLTVNGQMFSRKLIVK